MPKTLIQRTALGYCVIFLSVFLLNYVPAIHDANGLMFGLFKLDLIDDVLHLGSAVWALGAGLYSVGAATFYFRCFGVFYFFDGVFGMVTGKGFLDLGFLAPGPGVASLLTRLEVNTPHLFFGGLAVVIGFFLYKKLSVK